MRLHGSPLPVALAIALAACGREAGPVAAPPTPAAERTPAASTHRPPLGAQVLLEATPGQQAAGALAFTLEADGVRAVGTLTGLVPDSVHGFHIHEFGDCSAPDASSAGGHFAPGGNPHGNRDTPDPHHAGDMPNQIANARGEAEVDVLLDDVQIGTGDARDIVGRSVVLHAQADDYASQPSGAAGPRLACGVIRAVGGDAVPGATVEEATKR